MKKFTRPRLARIPAILPGLLILALTGCASWQAPTTLDDTALRERAVSGTIRDVEVRSSVLSESDNEQFFGENLNDQGVQTVWVEVDNRSAHTLWLLTSGTDPDYFSPLEVAWPFHTKFADESNSRIDQHFDDLGFKNPIPPGATRSGFLYTNPHHRTRVLNVDLLGQQTLYPFTLFPTVPGEQDTVRMSEIYALIDTALLNSIEDEASLRDTLEQLPCCATSSTDGSTGDPINIIMIGDLMDIASALVRRGYRHGPLPVDDTQLYNNRPADIVMRKAGQGGVTSNWLRAWLAPFSFDGHPVLLMQSGRPVGGRFIDIETDDVVLHPDIDETRSVVVQDMMYSGGLEKLGYIAGIPPVTTDYMSEHLGDLRYHTDGLRAVMFIITRPLSLDDVQVLDWVPLLERMAIEAEAELIRENSDDQSPR